MSARNSQHRATVSGGTYPTTASKDESLRIVVADDEQDMRDYFRKILPRLGHVVVGVACNGTELVERCRSSSPDLVITDIKMPDMDGIEAARALNAERRVPVILVSAFHDPELIRRAETDNIMGYLVKPIKQADLEPVIALATWRRRMEEELRLAKEATERAYDRIRRDVQMAAQLQRALLPTNLGAIPGIRFAWEYHPCAQLAGDGLNVFWLDDHHVGLYLLDVSGHGVAAALLSVTLARLLSPLLHQSTLLRVPQANDKGYRLVPPAEVALQLNQWLLANPAGDQYFTMVYGMLDVRTRCLRYVSAGHPGPILHSAGAEPTFIQVPGFPVGLAADADYTDSELQLKAGDRLFFYSDGITEAVDAAGQLLGLERLREAVRRSQRDTVEDSCAKILRDVLSWSLNSPDDDLSILALAIEPGM
jgi:sigma-B regulation protein RsbU (phosphoserine phosphatase)